MTVEAQIIRQIETSIALQGYLKKELKTLVQIAEQIIKALQKGNKVLLFGNGGSAANAQHIACELMGKLYRERKPLPAIALTTNTSNLTAIANDECYEAVFSRQLRGLVREGDIVIGISCSGESPNVLRGIEEGKRRGGVTIAFCGQQGRLKDLADYVLSIPSQDTPRVQEAHTTAGHIICFLVEETLFGDGKE